MKRLHWLAWVVVGLLVIGGGLQSLADEDTKTAGEDQAGEAASAAGASAQPTDPKDAVELFSGIEAGKLEMKFIAKSDRAARVLLTNKTKQPLLVRMPEAFAGVHVVPPRGRETDVGAVRNGQVPVRFASHPAQDANVFLAHDPAEPRVMGLPAAFADAPILAQRGGVGGFGGGGNVGIGGGGGFGGNQGIGGGFGGGGLGGFGGGGLGGGIFSIPPERTTKIDVPVVCLDHGLRTPSSSKPYQMVPIEQYVKRPAVIELVKAFGRGELQHGAAQAAAWHLNSDVSWPELATKLQGTERTVHRPPYFSRYEIQAGITYAGEALRRGQLAQMEAARESHNRTSASEESSVARSTEQDDASRADEEKDTRAEDL